MIRSIVPAAIRRQPWRVIIPLLLLVSLGTAVLYSAAGGSFRPWALSHFTRFLVFLGMALALSATVAAALTPTFICGMVLDVVGFVGSVVAARLIPLFLSQTIMSANLVVTAILGVVVLGVRLRPRDVVAIVVVVGSLCVLGLTAGHTGGDDAPPAVHWGVFAASVCSFSSDWPWCGSSAPAPRSRQA